MHRPPALEVDSAEVRPGIYSSFCLSWRIAVALAIPILAGCRSTENSSPTAEVLSPTTLLTFTEQPPSPLPPSITTLPLTSIQVTETPRPPALPNLSELARRACTDAENSPVVVGFIPLPLFIMKQVEYLNSDWEFESLGLEGDELIATDSDKGNALVCIRENWAESGIYGDGEKAYDNEWRVSIIAWPSGVILGKLVVSGRPPSIKVGGGPGYGDPPVEGLRTLLRRATTFPTLLIGDETHGFAPPAFSADGRLVALDDADGRISIWDLPDGMKLNEFAGNPFLPTGQLALSPDGSKVAASGFVISKTMVFDTSTGKLLYTLEAGFPQFSPDGKYLAVAAPIEIWLVDPEQGNLVGKMENGHDDLTQALAFSADGRWLVTGKVGNHELVVWDLELREPVWIFTDYDFRADNVAISADGRIAALIGNDGIRVLDIATGTALYTVPENSVPRGVIAFSPDGRYMVYTGSDDGFVLYAVDLEGFGSVELLRTIMFGGGLFFGPDGRSLYVIDGNDFLYRLDFPP